MKQNQVIAIEKGLKAKVISHVDVIDKMFQKPGLFNGFTKTYRKLNEADEDVPPSAQKVQRSAPELLGDAFGALAELFNVTMQKEDANRAAVADVRVGEAVILSAAPVTFLLFLEKQLTDMASLVQHMPVLDPAEDWQADTQGLFRTRPLITARTKKVVRPILLAAATVEHPAQAQLITEDNNVGTWELVNISGAVPEPKRKALLERIESLKIAVKLAREQANLVEAPECNAGKQIMKWLTATEATT